MEIDSAVVIGAGTASREVKAPGDQLCGITDVGKYRDLNQDAFYLSDDAGLLIVADGMGGHRAGDVASRMAVATVVEVVERSRNENARSDERLSAESVLGLAFNEAQSRILDEGNNNTARKGMGTTLTACIKEGDRFVVCHVGDSRLYHLEGKSKVQRITRDHSLVEEFVQSGRLTPEEARVHKRKNQILRAIGFPANLEPDIFTFEIKWGDSVLLCSDGLWEAMTANELEAIACGDGTARQRAIKLVNQANQNLGQDNVTVVLYDYVPT